MKARAFKATPPPNLAGKKWSDRITRKELVALVAARIPREPGDDDAIVRNRVSAKINYDVLYSKKLKEAAYRKFSLGAISTWARQAWPGLFDDLPRDPRPTRAGISAVEEGDTVEATALALPGDLAQCHALIMQLEERLRALERE
jgi:hypothetical protein